LGHGPWKNIYELEENLTLEEVFGIVKAFRDKEQRERKTLFAVQGVDLDYEEYKANYKAIQKRADARRQGLVEENDEDHDKIDVFNADSFGLSDLGIEIEIEGE